MQNMVMHIHKVGSSYEKGFVEVRLRQPVSGSKKENEEEESLANSVVFYLPEGDKLLKALTHGQRVGVSLDFF